MSEPGSVSPASNTNGLTVEYTAFAVVGAPCAYTMFAVPVAALKPPVALRVSTSPAAAQLVTVPPTIALGTVVELYTQSSVKVVGQDTASLKVIVIVALVTTADFMVGTIPSNIGNVCVAGNCGKSVEFTDTTVLLVAGAVYTSVSVATGATRVTAGVVPVFAP